VVGQWYCRNVRWLAIVSTCFLFVAIAQLWIATPQALSESSFHIELTLQDPISGGPITQNDALTLTAKVFRNGVRAHGGVIVVTASAPTKRYLCEIHTYPYSRDTCQTHLPTPGFWHIVARLSTTNVAPWRYVASATIALNVFSDAN
jgi:hypothetical protein